MTRLLLHGRLPPDMLRTKLEQASSTRQLSTITTLLLSSWNFDEIDGDIIQLLIQYLEESSSHRPHHEFLEEVTLHNCHGDGEQQTNVVAAIVRSSPRCFTIRYDEQQAELPASVASGLIQGSSTTSMSGGSSSTSSRLQAFQLRGVTLTPLVVKSFRLAFSPIPEFHSLSIKSHITLVELDRTNVSILGRGSEHMDAVTQEMIKLLQELRPHLTCLDLENCHISDAYLSQLLRAAVTTSNNNNNNNNKSRLTTLKLRGNIAEQETMAVLSDWMTSTSDDEDDECCPLQHLDLSWQRLCGSSTNCSPFSSQMPYLAKAIGHNKSSLKTLRLSENRLLDADMKLLCMALIAQKKKKKKKNHPTSSFLQDLDLQDCRITMEGFRLLAKCLPQFHQLRRLNLNGAQHAHATKLKSLFFAPLSQNVYLHELVLPNSVHSKSLAWLLEWNKAGRRVLVKNSENNNNGEEEVSPSLWPTLLERADKVGQNASAREPVRHSASAIYYLLRAKGVDTIAKYYHHSGQQQQKMALPPTSSTTSTSSSTAGSTTTEEYVSTPPCTPKRDDSSTHRRISPDSSFSLDREEDDDVTRVVGFTNNSAGASPHLPVIVTPEPRHLVRRSEEEIELRLETSSSFDKNEHEQVKQAKVNPLLSRPRLVANRTSSSTASSSSTSSTSVMIGHHHHHYNHHQEQDRLLRHCMMPGMTKSPSRRTRIPLAPVNKQDVQ